jgi:hypothetical protein
MSLTLEFLAAQGFKQVECSDGVFHIKWYNSWYFLQVDESLTRFTECDDGWVEELTPDEFIATIAAHNTLIKQ